MNTPLTIPPAIAPGDKIAILSPATEIREAFIDGAVHELTRRGYIPVVMPHARGPRHGSFAASDAERLADLRKAILDPSVKAILCSRGGYGAIHLLSDELLHIVADNPKWIIGFSDISALHALWQKSGLCSLHASMAKQLALYTPETQPEPLREAVTGFLPDNREHQLLKLCTDRMFSILEASPEAMSPISFPSPENIANIPGNADGPLIGGNLAVLDGLASTPWDILSAEYLKGKILFLEDVGEKIYRVERMLTRLHLAGAFDAVASIAFGDFTDYQPDRNFESMPQMIACRMKEWNVKIPVAFGLPCGHNHYNFPLVEGAPYRLDVRPDSAILSPL